MSPEDREILTALFAVVTAAAENVATLALHGQSARLTPRAYARTASRVATAAGSLLKLAEAAAVLANADEGPQDSHRKRRKPPGRAR